jgi:hypothetical protein
MSSYFWLLFAAGTIVCWGAYGPAIHTAQVELKNPWKALLLVGAAYFVLAVIVPPLMIQTQGAANWAFDAKGTAAGLLGGALGAVGAFCVILAMRSVNAHGGNPIAVMPVIFGGAPLVNVAVSAALHPPKAAPSPLFWFGIVVLAAGAGMVLYYKPQ